MTDSPINLALIYGSTRTGRLCETIAEWASTQIHMDQRFQLQSVDPARYEDALRPDRRPPPSLLRPLTEADAVLVVTPEYNHGYPAPLKALIDATGDVWQAKPVAFIAYGGQSGGLHAVEQLRPVLAELHAMTLRDAVYFPYAWRQFETGRLLDAEGAENAMGLLLARLHWWADALKDARWAMPYAQAVA